MLVTIKAVHSAIFLVMLSAIGWLLATGLMGRRDRSVAVAGALVAAESVVFLVNGGRCPLTPLAEHYGARRGGVSDIFLPDVVARTIPIWATSAVAVAVVLHLRRRAPLDRRVAAGTSPRSGRQRFERAPKGNAPGIAAGGVGRD
jgi:hypothetical protein